MADCAIQSRVEVSGDRLVLERKRNTGSLDLHLVATLLRVALGMTVIVSNMPTIVGTAHQPGIVPSFPHLPW